MTLSELSVRRPILMTMVYVLIITLAVLVVPKLNIALYPSVDMPILSVIVETSNAGPEESELQVARILENNLGSITGLENITTQSTSSRVVAMMEFSYATDMDEAYDDTTAKLNMIAKQLPDWASTPTVMRLDSMMGSTVVELLISGPYNQDELKTIAEDSASTLLERIEGVAQVTILGSDDIQYTVEIDPTILASYGLTYAEVVTALSSRNIQGQGGSLKQGVFEYAVTVDQRYIDIDQIRNTVVSRIGEVSIRVKDLAEVFSEAVSDSNSRVSYLNGEPVVMLLVSNESDSNASKVASSVIGTLDEINAQLPAGVELSVQEDSTTMISSTMQEVYKSAFQGIVLAALIIFLFLRGIKSTLIIVLSMPISILITLMAMAVMDVTINTMSMSGLILGIGMIVDASIVILERTYTYREKGYKPAIAAILGSKRMFAAIFASTMTTLCVFIPILVYRTELGMIGMIFQDLVITVCISLASSLFIAVTLVPALSGSILRIHTRVQKPLRFKVLRAIDAVFLWIEKKIRDGYQAMLEYVLRHRFLILVLIVLILILSLTFISDIGLSLIPSMQTDDSVTIQVTTPAGTSRNETVRQLFSLQEQVKEVLPDDSWRHMVVQTSSSSVGTLQISLPDITEQRVDAAGIKEYIRPLLSSQEPGSNWVFGGGRGPSSDSSIDIEIHATDTTAAKETSDMILSVLERFVPEAVDVTSDISDGAPRIEVLVDQNRADDLGVDMSTILATLEAAISGVEATTLNTFSDTKTYDLIVRFNDEHLKSTDELGALLVMGSAGTVRLDSFASFSEGNEAMTITRENKIRVNHVTASLAPGYSANEVQALVDSALESNLLLPAGVTIQQSGDIQQFIGYSSSLILIVAIALILVYSVMAAQFESLVDPLIIFASIPMILIGVVLIHVLMGQTFSLFSIVGIVALIGIVVNNGIVLVDSINFEVRQKRPIVPSCVKVAKERLRPILMTTLTTVLGLVPMAFFPGEGAELMQPIALTVVGGLLSGACITLFQTPILYSILNKRKERHFDDPMSLQNQLAEYDVTIIVENDD